MTEIRLLPDGPHSPAYTQEVGNALAECVRTLNHATRDGAPGLDYPGDVYTLLGALYTATGRLPQLLGQMAAFLQAQAGAGMLADNSGGDPAVIVLDATVGLDGAQRVATDLTGTLQDVQNAIAGLYVKEDDGG